MSANSSRMRRRSNSWSSEKQPAAQLSLPADDDVAGGNGGNLLDMPRICRCCCKRDLELLSLFGADKPTISSTAASTDVEMETDTDTSTMRRRSTTTSTPLGDRTNGNPVDYALSGAHSSMDIVLEEMIIWMLNVSRDDGLPQEICRQCMAQFLMVAKFRRKCVRMQQRLQDYAQEISDRQAARQAKRKQKQQQRQELQSRPQADKDTDIVKNANASDYMNLPESQMDRKRRIISESEGKAPSPLSSLPKIVKTEESVTEEVLPLPEGRRLQMRLRRMRTKSAGTTASAENAEEEPPVPADRSSMPWKTKAARKQLSESWSSYSPAPSSEVEGQWSNSSEAATENLSDLSVDPLCGFESDSNPSSTSAPSELKFPRRAPKANPAQRRGRRPRSSPVYMAIKRQRRSLSKKPTIKELLQQIGASVEENTKSEEKICCQNTKEEQYENDSLCPAAKSVSSDEESNISTSDAGESTVEIEEVNETNGKEEAAKELPSRTDKISSDSSGESGESMASPFKLSMEEEQKLNGATSFDLSTMELQSKELTSSTEATDTTTTSKAEQLSLEGEAESDQTEIIVSIPLEALNDDLQRRLCVDNAEEQEQEQEEEEDQQKKQQLPGNPDDVNNNANDEHFCQSATADSFNSAVALQTIEIEAKATGPPDGGTAAEPLIRVAESPPTPPDGDEEDNDTSASTDEIQVVRTGPTPMDFLAEFEKHCEKGLEQLGATTPASSPPATPRAEPLPLALNDLEAKQQLEVEMNDVETTLNGILNEMQDQHIYTPTCPHIDEFLTPADYASLSEPEQEQDQEPCGDIKPELTESQEKPNPNLFDNSNFSNELIGFQNDIPCFENIETTPEPEQSLHLELTQFLNELQPQPQPQQAVQTVQGPQVEVIPTEIKPVVELPQQQSPVQIQVQLQPQPLEHLQVRQPIVSKALEQVPQVHHQETTTTVSYEQIYHHHQQHSVQQQQSASKLQLAAPIDPQQQQQWQQYQPQEQQQQQTTHLQWSAVGGLEAIKSGIGPLDGTTTTYYISAGDLYQHQQQGAPLETTYTMLDPNENYILEQANHHQQQQQQQQQQQLQQQQQHQQPIMILIQQPEVQQPVASSSNPQQAPMHFYGAPISNELHHLQQQQQHQQQQHQQHQVQNHSVLGMQRVAAAAAAASPMPATTPKARAVSLKCRFCQNGPRFSNSLEYSRHIIELHPAVAPFNCPHCPLAFAARSKRSQHILNHHVVQQYQCGQCSQVFPAQRALDLHIQRFHMQVTSNTGGSEKGGGGVRVEEVQLQISNEQQQQQQTHPSAKQPGPRRQRILCCPDCEDCTSGHSHGSGQYEELQTNLQAPPTVLTPPSTIMSVPSPQPMMSTHQHITLPSPEQSEPDSTTTLRQFRKRGVIVSPQSGIFNQTLQLATPVASPSPSPSSSPSSSTIDSVPNTLGSASASVQVSELRASHQCLYCEERFTNDIALRKHHQLAHGAQTSMPFVCTICKRGYRMRTALHRHMESHDVEGRPYECNLCHVRFPRPSQLTLHKITVHLLSKPHTCDECGKQFGTESALKTHVKFHGAHMNSHLPLGVFLNEETQLKSSSNCSTTSNGSIHNDKSGENPATPSMEETPLTPSNINSNPDECCQISNSAESSALVGRSLPSLDSIAATP